MHSLISHGLTALISFVAGMLVDRVKKKWDRFEDRPKIRVEIHNWKLTINSNPFTYLLHCNLFNDGNTKDQLQEIIVKVNPDKIETQFYGENRFISGRDFQKIIVEPKDTCDFFFEHLVLWEPWKNLTVNDRGTENFRKIELILKFARHSPIKLHMTEDIIEYN